MASAAGLLSPGLVSLVKRAQNIRQEMDPGFLSSSSENIFQSKSYSNKPKPEDIPQIYDNGLVCKTCSYEALSNNHEWNRRSSTDALNNNLRPKSEFSDGSTSSLNKNRKVPVTDIYLNDPFEVGGDDMEFLEPYFPTENHEQTTQNQLILSVPRMSTTKGLKRSLSDFQSNGSRRPPLPPKTSVGANTHTKGGNLGRANSGEIANKINKFEQLAKQGSPPREDIQKGLWFYKDGLRSPSTPPPRSRSNSLSPSPVLGHQSTSSLPAICVQVSTKETPSPQPPASFTQNGQIEPKVITAALASSPKLFQKSERTVTIPAAFVLTPKSTPKNSPAPTPPRTPSPSLVLVNNGPARPPRKKTPPIPPPRTNSSLIKKTEILAANKDILKQPDDDLEKSIDNHLKLDEILDICSDFEKQIQAEQDELKLIAEKILKEEQDEKTREIQFHEIFSKQQQKEKLIHQPEFCQQVEEEYEVEESKESFPTKASEDIYHFGSISFYPSTPPLPARRAISPLKSPTNGVTSLQWSPINTMSPNRIKTNGSLPKEKRPQDFNGYLNGHTNNINGLKTSPPESMFSFESTYGPAGLSPPSTMSKSSLAEKSPYENINNSSTSSFSMLKTPQSPRTQIRTMLPPVLPEQRDNEQHQQHIGAGEDLFSTNKSKEELYLEAKHVLNLIEPYSLKSSEINGVVPRKPPRSKPEVKSVNQESVQQRVMIGTYMIHQKNSPEHTLNKNGVTNQTTTTYGYSNNERNELLRQEYQNQLQIISQLKKQLNDLELKETEEINQLELERSLLNAEFDSESQKISKVKLKIALLKHKETRLSGFYEELQKEFRAKMIQAESRIATLEEGLERMKFMMGQEDQMPKLKEQLDAENKALEDMEFHQMEEAAHKETERDELRKEITEFEKQVENHETQLVEIDQQQKQLLSNVRQETECLEQQRKNISGELLKEKDKMKFLENRMEELRKQHLISMDQSEVDFLGETESEGESLSEQTRTCSELEASLSRLALLDKTQQEIDQISVATETMLQQSPRKYVRISSQNWSSRPPSKSTTLGLTESDTLNSIGSENGSLSDIHSESCYGSNDCLSNGKNGLKSKQLHHQLKSAKDPESTSSGHSPDLTLTSRPMSEESSLWDDTDTEVRRRQNKVHQQQRPLTRYLPIRNENFDLRAHIESAGHQIDQCPHLYITPESCRGYLHKLSGHFPPNSGSMRFRSKWNKRWFVFDRNKRAIIYFSDKTETKAKGGVYFKSIEEVYVDHMNHVKSPNTKVTFCMKTNERTYFLMAPSPETMRIWIDVIFTGAEGYQEFQQI